MSSPLSFIRHCASRGRFGFFALLLLVLSGTSNAALDSSWIDSVKVIGSRVVGWALVAAVGILLLMIAYKASVWAIRRVMSFFGR